MLTIITVLVFKPNCPNTPTHPKSTLRNLELFINLSLDPKSGL